MKQRELVILMGIQGSGKSTFYATHLEQDYVRVNLDTLRTRNRERLLIEQCLAQGIAYAVDNTNPTRDDRARYIPAARAAGYRIIGYFLSSHVPTCMARNRGREGRARVPDVAIVATARKLERPHYDEGFDELYYVGNDGEHMTVLPWSTTEQAQQGSTVGS